MANFDVSTFLQNLKKGGLRPSLFSITMSSHEGNIQGAEFACSASKMPASKLGEAETHFMGRAIQLPGVREYEDWTVTVIADEDNAIRAVFERWIDAINGAENNVNTIGSTYGHMQQATVVTWSKYNGSQQSVYTMNGIWPTNVGDIELSWEKGNEIATFDVTFRILNFKSRHGAGLGANK